MSVNIEIELDKIKNKSFNNEEEKLKELEELEKNSNNSDEGLLFELGKSYFLLNKFNEAKKYFIKVLKINNTNIYAVDLLSKVYKQMQQYYYALRILYKCRKYSVNNTNKEIVSIYVNKQRYDLAIKYIFLFMDNFYEKKYDLYKYAISIISHLNVNNNRRKVCAYSKRILKNIDKEKDPKFYNSILNELEIAQRKVILKSYPRRMTISLISSCNLRCRMCPYDKNLFFTLSKYQVDNIIKVLPYIEDVEWNGGEAFIFKYFDLLLDAGYKNNVKQYVTSNGLLINDKYAEKIVKYDVDLTLSIDSVDKDLYENIRVGANFDLLVKNIENINGYAKKLNKKLNLSINSVLSKWNYKNKNNFIDVLYFAKKYNFSNVRITIDQYCIDRNLILEILSEFNIQKKELIELAKKLNINIQFVMPSLNDEKNVLDGFFQLKEEKLNKNIKIINVIKTLLYSMFEESIIWIKRKLKKEKEICAIKKAIVYDKYIRCSLPFKKFVVSFKSDFKPECICPDFLCHLYDGSIFDYYYSNLRFKIYRFFKDKEKVVVDELLNNYKIKTGIYPLRTYKTIEEIWNCEEIQEIRLKTYQHGLYCLNKCYLSEDKKHNI